jgi:hypothetical protein
VSCGDECCRSRACRVHAGRASVITTYQCVIETVAGFPEFVFSAQRGSRQTPTEALVAQTTAPTTLIRNIQLPERSLDSLTGTTFSCANCGRSAAKAA